MGSCLIHFNTVIAGSMMRQMYKMLRHLVLGALTFMIYQETHTATITCGSKCFILLLRTMLCFDDCGVWTDLIQTYKNISGGVERILPPPKYGLDRDAWRLQLELLPSQPPKDKRVQKR